MVIMNTIEEAKQFLRENWKEGVNCPCCTQYVRLWKYQIHTTMTRLLIALYRLSKSGEEFHHINTLWEIVGNKSMGGDFAKLTLWDLIAPMPKDSTQNKRATGYWKITPLGKQFVENKVSVDKILYTFDGVPYIKEGKVTVIDTLKKKFNYEELMNT